MQVQAKIEDSSHLKLVQPLNAQVGHTNCQFLMIVERGVVVAELPQADGLVKARPVLLLRETFLHIF